MPHCMHSDDADEVQNGSNITFNIYANLQ